MTSSFLTTKHRKTVMSLAAIALAAASSILATATPSQAASCSPPSWQNSDTGYGYVANWNWLHVAPYGACAGVAQPGQFKKVWFHCYRINDYGNEWTHVRIDGESTQGWISNDDLTSGSRPTEKCT